MKRSSLKFFIFFLMTSALLIHSALAAQTEGGSSAVESVPLTIIITGTRSFADFNVIEQNIKKVAGVINLVESVASQNHIQLTGTFTGDADSLISDIESLSQDRFTARSKKDKNRGVIVSLRKIR